VFYALRDRTGTVESPGLICSSILSKKLAAGLDALVLDVKTGSGSFLRDRKDADYLAALLVTTAESAGTRTVALMTDMGQPLGSTAGNWIEVAECVELLRGARPAESEDLRELSLILAGWMIHLGGKAETPERGYQLAEDVLQNGEALRVFLAMVEAQGGDTRVFDSLDAFHNPGATEVLPAWRSGFVAEMDTTDLGWAIQRLGAGRCRAGEPIDPHAGIVFHARRGARIEEGQPLATLYATRPELLADATRRIKEAIVIAEHAPAAVPLIDRIFAKDSAEAFLAERSHS
jgi:thymidine phosphorylase